MNVEQVLYNVDRRYPNDYNSSAKIVHLGRLENMLRREIYNVPILVGDLTSLRELVAHPPFEAIYEHYVTAMLAQMDGEYTRHNAELGLYAALWSTLSRSTHRKAVQDGR